MLSKKTGKIDWNNKGGERIINTIRGLKPWPSAYTIYKGQNVKIHEAEKKQKSFQKWLMVLW